MKKNGIVIMMDSFIDYVRKNFYSDFDEFKNTLYNYFLYNKNDITKLIDLTKFTFDIGLKNIIYNIEFIKQ